MASPQLSFPCMLCLQAFPISTVGVPPLWSDQFQSNPKKAVWGDHISQLSQAIPQQQHQQLGHRGTKGLCGEADLLAV